jgi:hypothetical protein
MHSMHDITVTFLRHVLAWQFINVIHFTLIDFKLGEYFPWRKHCHAATCRSRVTVISCTLSALVGALNKYIKKIYIRLWYSDVVCVFVYLNRLTVVGKGRNSSSHTKSFTDLKTDRRVCSHIQTPAMTCRAVPKGDLEKSLSKWSTPTRSRYGCSPIKYGLIINSYRNETIHIFSDKKGRKVAVQCCITCE